MNLLATLSARLEQGGRQPFLITGSKRYRYTDLKRTMLRAQPLIKSLGQGARVIVACDDELVASAAFLISLLGGLVPVMLPTGVKLERIQSIITSTNASLVISDNEKQNLEALGCPVAVLKFSAATVTSPFGWFSSRRPLNASLGGREDRAVSSTHCWVEGDALAYILFTSGTTSSPSGVEITRAALQAQLQTLCRLFGYGPGDCIANPTPLAHTDGLVQGLLLAVYSGASLLRQGPFKAHDIDAWMNLLAANGATHFITNPTVLRLLRKSAPHADYFSAPGFRAVISSAATLSESFWLEFEQHFSCQLFNLYGMTETVANATYAGRHPEMGAIGSIGKPVDCVLRLRSPESGAITESGIGEIELQGDNICRRYWRDPDRDALAFTSDGWLKTGDLAQWRPDGSLDFVGRAKSIILTGGLTLSPDEIDEAILSHPQVQESVTVGLPHDEFEEIAVTAVVLKPVSGNRADAEELMSLARAKLEPLKVPKHIICFAGGLPRGPSGKPDLTTLRRQIQERLGGQGASAELSSGSCVPNPNVSPCLEPTLQQQVIALAAQVFNVAPEELSESTQAGVLTVWDSFNHMTLIVEVERHFGVSLSTPAIVNIKTLADLAQEVANAGS
jgi:long-chain acyl-CoA synthetase